MPFSNIKVYKVVYIQASQSSANCCAAIQQHWLVLHPAGEFSRNLMSDTLSLGKPQPVELVSSDPNKHYCWLHTQWIRIGEGYKMQGALVLPIPSPPGNKSIHPLPHLLPSPTPPWYLPHPLHSVENPSYLVHTGPSASKHRPVQVSLPISAGYAVAKCFMAILWHLAPVQHTLYWHGLCHQSNN